MYLVQDKTNGWLLVLYFGQVHRQAGFDDDASPVQASKNIQKIARAVHQFNEHVRNDPRVQTVILPVFDGVSVIRKKG